MEIPDDVSILEATFKMINAETQLVWSSDYPHWDFDLPSSIYDLPFLKEQAKRNILGGNAAKLYDFDLEKLTPLAQQYGPTVAEISTPLERLPEDANSALLRNVVNV